MLPHPREFFYTLFSGTSSTSTLLELTTAFAEQAAREKKLWL
jgi:hypothetical protein